MRRAPLLLDMQGAGLTPGVLFSQSSSVTLLRAAMQFPRTRGKENLTLWRKWLVGQGMCVALVREEEVLWESRSSGTGFFILPLGSGTYTYTYSSQITFLENIKDILENGSSMSWQSNSFHWVNRWLVDWRNGFPVYGWNHKIPSVSYSHNYIPSLGEQPDKLPMDLFQRGKCFL